MLSLISELLLAVGHNTAAGRPFLGSLAMLPLFSASLARGAGQETCRAMVVSVGRTFPLGELLLYPPSEAVIVGNKPQPIPLVMGANG